MNPPVWLVEFHRQWQASRGRKLSANARSFARDWPDLMERTGVRSEDQAAAVREAEKLEKEGRLQLKRHRYRHYLIERVLLPIESEPWLRDMFGSPHASSLRDDALSVVRAAQKMRHPLYPQLWAHWCERICDAFTSGKTLRPMSWREPKAVRSILEIVRGLTVKNWPQGTLIRTASKQIGLDSKSLERHRRSIESALAGFFGRPTPLEALGIVGSSSHVWLNGPLTLHFEDGTTLDYAPSRDRYIVTYAELVRAVALSTSAERLLSVENEKTTFRQLAAANADRRTLIVATSFPSQAMRLLMGKLSPELPHFHFGDTDPAGWHILLKLREVTPRVVLPFLMQYRAASAAARFSEYDLMVLPKLLASPLMEDCRASLLLMMNADTSGDFEQESLGPPSLTSWPFFKDPMC